VLTMFFTRKSESARGLYFNCLIEIEGLIKVRGSHLHYTVNVVISRKQCKMQTPLLQTTNRKLYVAYQTVTIPMTLSDLQGHAPIAGLLKCNFSYSCAAADKASADKGRRAVPLR